MMSGGGENDEWRRGVEEGGVIIHVLTKASSLLGLCDPAIACVQ